jgi:hypothetical protein
LHGTSESLTKIVTGNQNWEQVDSITKTGISKATFLSLSVIAACPQSFWVFQKDSRQAGMTTIGTEFGVNKPGMLIG